MFERIKSLIVQELGVDADKVTLEARLADDLGADSLDAVELIMAIEEEFDIEVNDEAAQQINQVKDIVEQVEKLVD